MMTASIKQAQQGDSWTAAWQTPAIQEVRPDGTVRTQQYGGLVLYRLRPSNHDRHGGGTLQLDRNVVQLPITDTASLAAAISPVVDLGRAGCIDRAMVKAIVEDAPVLSSEIAAKASAIDQTFNALEAVKNTRKIKLSDYTRDYMWSSSLIYRRGVDPYGVVYVPSSQANGLCVADGEEEVELSFTHSRCDLLKSKWSLLTQLGLGSYIAHDQRLIDNALGERK